MKVLFIIMSIFCLIQGINNYVQINTYWRYIVRIMTKNILSLASKTLFPTSQGLVGAGMNCKALPLVWWIIGLSLHLLIPDNKLQYSQRHTMINHYDRRITLLSDNDTVQSETYQDKSL
jgi:hypothetical protein